MGTFDITADFNGESRLTDLQITLHPTVNNYTILFVDQSVSHNLPMIHHGFDALEPGKYLAAVRLHIHYRSKVLEHLLQGFFFILTIFYTVE